MRGFPRHSLNSASRIVGVVAATVLLAAACGSSNGSNNSSGAGGGGATHSSSGAGAATATVDTHSGPLGTYLTNSKGLSLYMFASDTAGKSSCSGPCVTYWPPVTATGKATAGGAAASGMLGTITRNDGSKQVTYNGHPLYTFAQDTSPGDTTGQGSSNFGAKWWLLTPSGKPITSGAGAASTSPGGGGGY